MGMRRRLLRDVLSSLKYIKNLTEQQIRASLWRGEGTLYDIELDPQRLQELLVEVCPVALEILDLRIDELYVKIPWSQLGTHSVLVVAKSVSVRFAVHCEDEADWRATIGPLLRKYRQKIRDTLHAAPGSLTDPAGALNQLRQRLLHSLQMRADRIRVTVVSRHARHFGAHRPTPPEDLEEALAVEFEDVFLTPCDMERCPSEQIKAMAVYEPRDRVLTLMRLLKCRAFTVLPGAGATRCPCAAAEFMEAPGVLMCSIIDRCTSDGPRICPCFLSQELLFDIASAVRIRCCECQLGAFLGLISDVAALEEWRLDPALVGERTPKLMNTSDVARTFAQGPSLPPVRPQPRSPQGKRCIAGDGFIRATSASGLSASIWNRVVPKRWSSAEAEQDSHRTPTGSPLRSPAEGHCEALDHCPERPPFLEPLGGEGACEEPVGDDAVHSQQLLEQHMLRPWQNHRPHHLLDREEGDGEVAEFDTDTDEGGAIGQEQDLGEDDEEDEFCDVDDMDYYSVASDMSPAGGLEGSGQRGASADWLDSLRSWFGGKVQDSPFDEGASSVDLCNQQIRLSVSVHSLAVHVSVPSPEGAAADVVEYSGDGVSLATEAKYEFTEAQRECVRRFASPSEERTGEQLWPWQLPQRIASSQVLTFHRWHLSTGGVEVARDLTPDQTGAEAMFLLSIRPRSAPPEVLVSQDRGELPAWPSQLRLSHTLLCAEPRAGGVIGGLFKRVRPFLVGKVPPPELITPGGSSSGSHGRVFPAQCLSVELCSCEVVEPDEGRAISGEQRWPWRTRVPYAVVRSDSAFWDLSGVFGESLAESRPAPSAPSGLNASSSRGRLGGDGGGSSSGAADGMVSIPKEMFDELVRRAAENAKKDSQVSAAREELQRAYISLATSRPHSSVQATAASAGGGEGHDSDGDQDEVDKLRQRCMQLELSLQSQALAQRRLETELAHHQARAHEELRRLLQSKGGRQPVQPQGFG